MLNKSTSGLPETQAEMGVGRGAPGSEDQSEPGTTPICCSSKFWGWKRLESAELFDQEHWDSWILPRLTDDPTARDLSIKCFPGLRSGRKKRGSKALAENFMNSEAAKNDVLLELALRQSLLEYHGVQESKSNWVQCLGVATPRISKFGPLWSSWPKQ